MNPDSHVSQLDQPNGLTTEDERQNQRLYDAFHGFIEGLTGDAGFADKLLARVGTLPPDAWRVMGQVVANECSLLPRR